MKPTKYELFERDGAIVLRGYASEAQDGWFNVEVVNRISWRTFPTSASRPPTLLRVGASRSRTSSSAISEGVAAQRRHQYVPAVRILLGVFPVQRLNACVNALTS